MFNLNYNFMAKFNDSQLLQLLVERINEMYGSLNKERLSHDLDLFESGRKSVLDSLSEALSFYQDYEFD